MRLRRLRWRLRRPRRFLNRRRVRLRRRCGLRRQRLRRSRSILDSRRLLSRLQRLSKGARRSARLARTRSILDARLRLLLLLYPHAPFHVAVQLLLLPLRSRLLPLLQPRVLPPLLCGPGHSGHTLLPLDRGGSRLDHRLPWPELARRPPNRRRLVDRQRLVQRLGCSPRNRSLHSPARLRRRWRPPAPLPQNQRQTGPRRQESRTPTLSHPVSSHRDHLRHLQTSARRRYSPNLLDASRITDAPELDRCPR